MSRRIPQPAHGTPSRYLGTRSGSRPPCGCRECVAAHTRACSERELAHLSGRPPRVPTGPVTDHVNSLLAADMSRTQIAIAAGVSRSSVCNAAIGKNPTSNRTVADKILAVRPRIVRSTDRLPMVGTRRRLQALYTIGHGALAISAASGLSMAQIQNIAYGRARHVTAATYKAVRAAYRQLAVVAGHSAKAKASACRNGWLPPTAWAEDIDNPTAVPDFEATTEAELSRNQLAAIRRAEVEHFDLLGLSSQEIADKLGMAYTTVRNIVLELRSGQRRIRPREGASAPGPAVPLEVAA